MKKKDQSTLEERCTAKLNKPTMILPGLYLENVVWACMGVFVFWLIVGHGFWLGWQYGIHTLSPGDIVFIPYSEKITLNALFITLITAVVLIGFMFIKKKRGNFKLVPIFDPARNEEVKVLPREEDHA